MGKKKNYLNILAMVPPRMMKVSSSPINGGWGGGVIIFNCGKMMGDYYIMGFGNMFDGGNIFGVGNMMGGNRMSLSVMGGNIMD